MIDIIKILDIFYLLSFLIYIFLEKYIKKNYTFDRIILIIFIAALAYMAYIVNPPKDWDLYKHLLYIDDIRKADISIWEFLFNNNSGIGGVGYRTLYAFNVLRYLIVKIGFDIHFLPAISIIIDYAIICYIAYDWTKGNNIKFNFTMWILCFALFPYIHAVSGIRNGLSSSIMALSIYLYLYKKKNIVIFIILSVISILIHPISLIAIPFVFMSRIEIGLKGMLIVFLIPIFINYIVLKTNYESIEYLNRALYLYQRYTSDNQYRGRRSVLLGCLLIVFIIFILSLLMYLNDRKKEKTYLNLFFLYYSCFILGNIGNYDLVLRPAYLLGALAIPLTSYIANYKSVREGRQKALLYLLYIALTIICMYIFIIYLQKFMSAF